MSGGGDVGVVLGVRLVADVQGDDEEGDRLTRQLRAELADLDVDRATLGSAGTAPEGSKVTDPVTIGAIVVALGASGGVLP